MLVGNKVSYGAISEAYCLLSAYIREDGMVGAKYNTKELLECVKFLAEILKHPENFVGEERTVKVRLPDGSLEVTEHDGSGLA